MELPVNRVLLGDSRALLRELPDNSVDSVVTDPPAGIEFMGADWDNPDKFGSTFTGHGYSDGSNRVAAPTQRLSTRNPNCRRCRKHIRGADGCRCEEPDSDEDPSFVQLQRVRQREGFVAFLRDVMGEVYRVLKPGGHALVWSLPRTSHWTALAIEDSGFEVRDSLLHAKDRHPEVGAFLGSLTEEQVDLLVRAQETTNVMAHLFGSGFPHSLDVSKAIDRMAGAERKVVRAGRGFDPERNKGGQFNSISPSKIGINTASFNAKIGEITEPATEDAKKWDGWGTVLKPSQETWWLVRKPLAAKNTVTQVLSTGTGALNIDSARVPLTEHDNLSDSTTNPKGRWPANFLVSHGPSCSPPHGCAPSCPAHHLESQFEGSSVFFKNLETDPPFVYSTKASRSDKNLGLDDAGLENTHPTVKSQALMTYLVRLVTPPNGVILDPFAGSGSTLVAAVESGFRCIGVEREPTYHAIAEARLNQALGRVAERVDVLDAALGLPQEE